MEAFANGPGELKMNKKNLSKEVVNLFERFIKRCENNRFIVGSDSDCKFAQLS